MTDLTPTERAALDDWWASDWPRDGRDAVDVLAEVVAGIAAARVAAAREAAAVLVEGLRVHQDADPYSTCVDGCGWFNYAAMKIRTTAKPEDER